MPSGEQRYRGAGGQTSPVSQDLIEKSRGLGPDVTDYDRCANPARVVAGNLGSQIGGPLESGIVGNQNIRLPCARGIDERRVDEFERLGVRNHIVGDVRKCGRGRRNLAFGRTRASNRVAGVEPRPSAAALSISTMASAAGSRPVVSRSMTAAVITVMGRFFRLRCSGLP